MKFAHPPAYCYYLCMSGKTCIQLIIVWSLVCASGLAVFLFEAMGPGSDGASEGPFAVAVTAGFWAFLWLVPVAVLVIFGRRRKGEPAG